MLSVRDERRNKKLTKLLDKSRRRIAKMTPAEVQKMLKRQAKSWTRQDKD